MSMRLNIFYGQARITLPYLATFELAGLFDVDEEDVTDRAALEGWKASELREIGENGEIETIPAWDVESMPYATRKEIAATHYFEEEQESALLLGIEEAALPLQGLFPHVNHHAITASLYRAQQFVCVRDAAISLRLTLEDALDAISHAFWMDRGILLDLNNNLDNGEPCSFIKMDEDARLMSLMLHFYAATGNLLPEFFPFASPAPQAQSTCRLEWN